MKCSTLFLIAGLAAAITLSGCKDDENPSDPGLGGGLTSAAFPNNMANLSPGGAAAVGTITGGTPPYSIMTAPDPLVATAALSGTNMEILTITPVAVGNTSVTIEDASTVSNDGATGLTMVIEIVVSEGGGGTGSFAGSGTMMLSTSVGTLNASGAYNENVISGQGVGGLRSVVKDYDRLDVIGYNARSATDVDVAFISYMQMTALATGTYQLIAAGGPFASVAFGFGINVNDPSAAIYVGTTGSANLASITQTTAAGNAITGSAINTQNTTMTATFSEGSFNVTGIGQGRPSSGDPEIEAAVLRLYRKWRASLDAK